MNLPKKPIDEFEDPTKSGKTGILESLADKTKQLQIESNI